MNIKSDGQDVPHTWRRWRSEVRIKF